MRKSRLRGNGHHFVHAMTRIVQRQFLPEDAEKERFMEIIRNQSSFSGLSVVTFAILDNHIHLLLEQPAPDAVTQLTADELFRRFPFIYSAARVREIRAAFEKAASTGDRELSVWVNGFRTEDGRRLRFG